MYLVVMRNKNQKYRQDENIQIDEMRQTVGSGAPEGWAYSTTHAAPVMYII